MTTKKATTSEKPKKRKSASPKKGGEEKTVKNSSKKKSVKAEMEKTSAKPKVSEKSRETEESSSPVVYLYAVGRRKTATAQVRLYAQKNASEHTVNEKSIDQYFPTDELRAEVFAPLVLIGKESEFRISVRTSGGGLHSQSQAVKLAVARALIKYDANLRSLLKSAKMLTRDPRKVERKKPGLKKARRAPQWAKR